MSTNPGWSEGVLNSGAKKKLEILYDGYYYDVTDFVPKHPGGDVIRFYTGEGEDATAAIQQLHNRSISKVRSMMKSMSRRPTDDTDVSLDSAKLERHRSMTRDFVQLFLDIKKEGLFGPSYSNVLWRLLEVILFWYLAVLCHNSPNIPMKVLACILFALGSGRAGWIIHEGGHNSLTGNVKVDKYIQSICMGLFHGLSATWWNRRHSRHHAMPQRVQHDGDLQTMPFLAHNSKLVKDPKAGKAFFIQNQAWLFLSLDCLLAHLAWMLYVCPRNAVKRGYYFDLFTMSLYWTFIYQIGLHPLQLLLIFWLLGIYTYGQISLSHAHLPITEEHTHWLEYGLVHTSNFNSNLFLDWWTGYLNFQIEHHLFPTLPGFRLHLVENRVKGLAKKYDLPYQCYSYFEAWGNTLRNLQDVAKELQ